MVTIRGRKQRKRQLLGWTALSTAVVAAGWPVVTDASWTWRLAVFIPALVGMLGLLQAKARTCMALAACGMRNMDEGNARIDALEELRVVERQAARITLQAVVVAVALTGLVLVL